MLDCTALNASMVATCQVHGKHLNSFTQPKNISSQDLYDSLIRHQVDTNRSWNRSICNQFDEMATRLGEIPDKTKELVDLQRYRDSN